MRLHSTSVRIARTSSRNISLATASSFVYRNMSAPSNVPSKVHHSPVLEHTGSPPHKIQKVAATAGVTSCNPFAPIHPTAHHGYSISSCMDAGNIELLGVPDPSTINLAIRPDPHSPTDGRAHFQWFNFRLTGAAGRPLQLRITNAGGASFAAAWNGYQAVASYDLEDWFRVPTDYDAASGVLTIRHTPPHDVVQYAYFAPYSLDRHAALLARMQGRARADVPVRVSVLGRTLDGRDLEVVQVGPAVAPTSATTTNGTSPDGAVTAAPATSPSGPLRIWVIARQHPGESMAEWFAEGLLERLTDPEDSVAKDLLTKAVFYVVPNMCPDGSFRGHLRTNAAGVNLNRVWAAPSQQTSPEVAATLAAIERTGVDFFLDVHGDEELPHVFVAGLDGIPAWLEGPRLSTLQSAFCTAAARHAPEFQTKYGYPIDKPGAANLTLASKQIGQRFRCLSLTLEMPFKDSTEVPDARVGWSAGRAKRLGAALLGAVRNVAHMLR